MNNSDLRPHHGSRRPTKEAMCTLERIVMFTSEGRVCKKDDAKQEEENAVRDGNGGNRHLH